MQVAYRAAPCPTLMNYDALQTNNGPLVQHKSSLPREAENVKLWLET